MARIVQVDFTNGADRKFIMLANYTLSFGGRGRARSEELAAGNVPSSMSAPEMRTTVRDHIMTGRTTIADDARTGDPKFVAIPQENPIGHMVDQGALGR